MAPTKRVDNEKCKLPPVQNGRVQKKSPAMDGGSPAKAAVAARQPIPSETLLEALLYLDRGQLEAVQLSCPRFYTIVEENMTGICPSSDRRGASSVFDFMVRPKV
ncbi:hypothetical protein AAVH_24623 [Aphelenchoides avenae]|nr:hypothetical protein AAVH_24623 [Aphelenchus avenae]